ncbi:hypothetical protein [Mesorhizobium huakuii]|uniref:Uncharacterized protein n=1 Tax=Mesorhizobium huakuii TaxID=28104 RepID=A0A7G6T5V4_9HYPH|nr:hypothetical protein [Mesorhizobium huakuii]QND62136.1 hypothetical protein HB778_39375 [Mesorhizobium huakuii]QND69501.1 hypothetical protein HB777_38310 [Mesorhizobium loti]
MTPTSTEHVMSVALGHLLKSSDRFSASSVGVARVELAVDDVGIVLEATGLRSARLISRIAKTLPDNEGEIRELLGENLLYCVSAQVALCADGGGALLLWTDIDNVDGDRTVVREQMTSFCNAVIYWDGISRRHRSVKQSLLSRDQNFARDLDIHWRNACDPADQRTDGKDVDRTLESARQTITQVESFLREGQEQFGRQAELFGDYAITDDVISAFVEAQDEGFRQAYTCERQAVLRDVMTPMSNQLPVRGPRVKPMRQRV